MEPIKKVLILSLIIIFSGTGCKKDKSDSPQVTLVNTNWTLAYIQNTVTNEISYFPAAEPKKIIISFSGTSDVISFAGICNIGDGTYTCIPEKGELKITNLVTTKIGCENAEWEGYTIQSLNKAYQYKIDGSNLAVYSNGDNDLYFEKQ